MVTNFLIHFPMLNMSEQETALEHLRFTYPGSDHLFNRGNLYFRPGPLDEAVNALVIGRELGGFGKNICVFALAADHAGLPVEVQAFLSGASQSSDLLEIRADIDAAPTPQPTPRTTEMDGRVSKKVVFLDSVRPRQ